jgi:hypothetical protein
VVWPTIAVNGVAKRIFQKPAAKQRCCDGNAVGLGVLLENLSRDGSRIDGYGLNSDDMRLNVI